MSNKIALATIQFRADAKGANVALDSLRASADDARKTMKEMQEALDKGIKTMKDANGVEFDVAAKFHNAEKAANSFEKALRELNKGATALETVVSNIRLGEIEKSSRAELKGAINAAQSRLRSIREKDEKGQLNEEDLERQRDLNKVITESQKQLNRLDRDTAKVVETLRNGGKVSEDVLKKEQEGLEKILSMIPKGTQEWKDYNAQLKQIKDFRASLQTKELEQTSKLLGSSNLGRYSEESIRKAISAAKELLASYETGSDKAQALSAQIVNAEEHLKSHGIEAARAAAREAAQIKTQEEAEKQLQATMRKRLTSLSTLSADALAESRKYWEAQRNGAEAGTAAFNKAEAALKKIANQERERKVAGLDAILGDPKKFGIDQVRSAVQEMEKLRGSVREGSNVWLHYNKMVEQGKAYLDQLAKTEALNKITTQMNSLTTLSASGLAEVKKYWETMVAGAAKGSTELANYEAELKKVITEEQERAKAAQQKAVGVLGGNLGQYSEAEIRQAIEAGKQLIQTYKTADPAAQQLAKNIVAAEEHLKQYGVEAERTAAREAEALKKAAQQRKENDAFMERQLRRGLSLNESALKAQVQYWQRLIDDPKTAASSVKIYEKNLEQAKGLLEGIAAIQIEKKGEEALKFFRGKTDNASVSLIEENKKALIAYRDSLPRKDNAQLIEEINSYIQKTGEAAKVAAGEVMSLADAEKMASQIGTKGFSASTNQLKQAKKALEEAQNAAGRGTPRFKQLQEAINKVDLELARTGEIAENVQKVLDKPKGQSLNALKQAVEQGRAALNNMDRSTTEGQKRFDELAKKIKAADQELKQLAGTAKGTASAFEKAWSRLKTYVGLYVGASVAMQKLTGTLGDVMELSDKMGEVRKTTGFTADEVGRLSESLKKLDTRTTLTGLMDLSVAAGQLGLKTEEDVLGFTEAANKLMVALPEMGKEGATEMLKVALATGEIAKIEKQMQDGLIEGSSATAIAMEKVGSTIDRLRATSAATAPAITDFVKRVGAVGAQSGITIDQVAALGSTVDALGMRVEMSATALSRMIPAIRNNAFAVAKAIGMVPNELRDMFNEAGGGMKAMLAIFQHIKDAGMSPDDIEKMLGMGGMQEVMKELNQQGARAGIVFAGLSQNVEILRRHLITAGEAYKENTAIQNEYNKMNETTAAKWERLVNQVEEFFVGDQVQKFIGGVIDGLRWIVDLLVGNNGLSPAILAIITLFTMLKLNIGAAIWGALAAGLTKIIDLFKNWRIALELVTLKMKEMTAAQWANVFLAVAAAIAVLVMKLQQWAERAAIVATEMAKLDAEILKQTKSVDSLFQSVSKTNAALDDARKRLEEVKKANEDTTEAENNLKKANAEHAASIKEINSKYGSYLGYMLSETSQAEQLAKARALINAKLRETITLKQQEAALGAVEEEYGGNVNKKATKMEQALQTFFGEDFDTAARVSVAISEAAQKYAKDADAYRAAVKKILADNKIQEEVAESYMSTFEDYREAIEEYSEQEDVVNRRFEARANAARKDSRAKVIGALNAIVRDWKQLLADYQKAEGEEKERLAAEVYKQQRSYANALANNAEYFEGDERKAILDENLKRMQNYEKGLREVAGEAIRTIDAMEQAEDKVTDFTNGDNDTNPWGTTLGADSTDWKNMTAEQLVNRRKQMNDFVKAIQTDTDVQTVLGEDAALKKAIENGMSSDMRTVIEWYNTERLKIQDELYARHLTNTGDWRDPEKGSKSWRKQLQTDFDTYLKILDAYYTERKARIEKAQTEEGMSEAEAQRLTIENETVWRKHRMELQKIYLGKGAEIAKEERQRIYNILGEQDEEDPKFVEQTIARSLEKMRELESKGEQGLVEYRKIESKLVKDIATDLYKQQNAVANQMEAIRKIIAQERPFDGLVENLQQNLSTMGVLFADLDKKRQEAIAAGLEPEDDAAKRGADAARKRMLVLMQQAEEGYTVTFERLKKVMVEEGFADWASAIENDDQMRKAMMAMLRKMYDDVHAAIKKESSQMKKELDIWWNDTEGEGQLSRKGGFEKMLSDLGLQEDQVKRANSLIGAGAASERVADRLAIQQMRVRLAMQNAYYAKLKEIGRQRVRDLEASAEEYKRAGDMENYELKMLDAKHAQQALNLSLSEEQNKVLEQQVAMQNQMEESQNRLYTELKAWGDLLTSSVREVFEAGSAGNEDYYNERAKLDLTGKGGPGAGTYVVIDNAGTSNAKAHYEYLDERAALEREHEIEQENARAEAWRKVMDDINMKLSETITDQLNAMLQNASIDANTDAVLQNTEALAGLTGAMNGGDGLNGVNGLSGLGGSSGSGGESGPKPISQGEAQEFAAGMGENPALFWAEQSDAATAHILENQQKVKNGQLRTDSQMQKSSQSTFAKMTSAANLYGVAYQAMTNDNLSAVQKFEMIALQAAGQAAIAGLTADLSGEQAKQMVRMPGILGKLLGEMPYPAAMATFALITALMGGLMGMAVSQVSKSKSQIAQATGATGASAGKLTTGMLTYAEGNVNEFTDPATLTPGRSYNVDGRDGRTYRARYMGKGAKTHITNGPEFHLVGEAGREAIIDAKTTRLIRMNDTGIWQDIQTLYRGGSLSDVMPRRRRGIRAFASGNIDELGSMGSMGEMGEMGDAEGGGGVDAVALQASLDRNSAVQEALLERLNQPIYAQNILHGADGLPNVLAKLEKEAKRHGVKYL